MTTQEKFVAAVKLRLDNKLDQCQEAVEKLWNADKFQTPGSALLRGNLRTDLGDYEGALQWHALAWEMTAPNNRVRQDAAAFFPEVALPLAYSRMRLGLWDKHTWALWEIGRLTRSWHPVPNTRPWDGSPEKTIVLSEGGYGDVFLYTRFFQKLDPIQRAASRFVIGPQMKGLKGFRGDWDGMPTVHHDEEFNWKPFRFSTALMSLMAVMQIRSPKDIPAADKSGIAGEPNWPRGEERWENPLKSYRPPRKKLLGLCWRAEENGVQKRIRSIDNSADLEPLARWSFVNLNPGKTLLSSPTLPRLIDADLRTWTDTARVIAGLDCVVTVDSAVAHLAGLLGVPTLMIVPLNVDWKYGVAGEDCFWWPSLKVIRNTSPYTFRPAVEEVAARLEKL